MIAITNCVCVYVCLTSCIYTYLKYLMAKKDEMHSGLGFGFIEGDY